MCETRPESGVEAPLASPPPPPPPSAGAVPSGGAEPVAPQASAGPQNSWSAQSTYTSDSYVPPWRAPAIPTTPAAPEPSYYASPSVEYAPSTQAEPLPHVVAANGRDDNEEVGGLWGRSRSFGRAAVAFLSSMAFHLVGMIVLALWMAPIAKDAFLELEVDADLPLETVLLEEELQPAQEMAWQESAALLVGTAMEGAFADIQLASAMPEVEESPRDIAPDPFTFAIGSQELLAEHGGKPGLPRIAVDGYRQALDHITQELLRLLSKDKVLVVWCFDESESMKDDQEEIAARIDRVYAELGMTADAKGDALTTGVTSFGDAFHVHTAKPTVELDEIREAIAAIPVCESGEEMMCNAVVQSINTFRSHARHDNRQVALILVSDESGNRAESDRLLEPTIHHARSGRCKVYVLGREAAFGQPLAHVRWVHPQTRRRHWLPVDRGPESASVEQLQTDGFGQREDAHPSGFGPYAQSRLAWETGGKFFMLPSPESDLAWNGTEPYSTKTLDAYRPDLRAREDVLREIGQRPLRRLITQVVNDLDPSRDSSADLMRIREEFSADAGQMKHQIESARNKAIRYYSGLERAITLLDSEKAIALRDADPSQRWKANYDLLRAQVLAYAARVYLYGAALEDAVKQVDQVPTTRGEEHLQRWRLSHNKAMAIDERAADLLSRAHECYQAVVANHPGTPWASRADWEMKRLFQYPEAEATASGPRGGKTVPHLAGDGMGRRAIAANLNAGIAVGAGGGGGGGGGGGIGVGMELVPEYGVPQQRVRPPEGGNGPPQPSRPEPPEEPRIPIPKL